MNGSTNDDPFVKRLLERLACLAGVHACARWWHRRELLIVMYHGLTHSVESARRWWHLVRLREFERQVAYLRRWYHVLPLDEALEKLWAGEIRRPTACITFDDGYRNNLTLGLPVLERMGVPATIYVATGMVGTDRRLWTVELDAAFWNTSAPDIDLSGLGGRRVSLASPAARTAAFDFALERLKALSPARRETLLGEVHDQLRPGPFQDDGEFAMMSWSDIQDLGDPGLLRFAGHTVNHEIVSRLDDDTVRFEIRGSIEAIERHARSISRTFAYPNGGVADFDERAVRTVDDAGLVGAVTTVEGLCGPAAERFALPRISVGSDTTLDRFRLATSGVLVDVKKLTKRNATVNRPTPRAGHPEGARAW